MKRKVCLLGASGSIGSQTIDVMIKNPSSFELVAFSVFKQTRKISSILKKFPSVKYVCVGKKSKATYYSLKYPSVHFFFDSDGIIELIKKCEADMVVNAIVGFAGMVPTIESLKLNKIVCLANKESLVVGGEIINALLDEGHGKLFPIDSEHCALWKCLSIDNKNVEKLIITASGGAFRNLTRDELKNVTPEDALKHPTWSMGNKITIDSATMVNKTFEIIEAYYLFRYPFEKIDVIMNYESYVHSIVMYNDGTYRMDVSKPDMRVPIKHALFEGTAPFTTYVVNSLENIENISFHPFSLERYPIVRYAEVVMKKKGTYGAVLNAANEEAVYAFLAKKISFLDIEKIIETLMDNHRNKKNPSVDDLIRTDKKVRAKVRKMIKEWRGQ